MKDDDRREFQELLGQPLSEGKIARAWAIKPDIEQFVSRSKNWEPTAGNWREILDHNVRNPMRFSKDPRLLDTWQFQMKLETSRQTNGRDDIGKANFTQVEMPRMMWGRARDMIVLGQTNGAINEMAKLVRAYPQHPDFPAWVAELSGILKTKTAPAPAFGSTTNGS